MRSQLAPHGLVHAEILPGVDVVLVSGQAGGERVVVVPVPLEGGGGACTDSTCDKRSATLCSLLFPLLLIFLALLLLLLILLLLILLLLAYLLACFYCLLAS